MSFISILVSIVVPVYNVEKYLLQCVESIERQTYRNLEIILVDDGSPDKCGEICDRLGNQDQRIRVIKKKNGGLSDARNAGIDIAKGDYITFIDSDDYILDNMIEHLLSLSTKYDGDIVECRNVRCGEDGSIINKQESQKKSTVKIYTENGKMEAFFSDDGIDTTAWGKLYKTSLFKSVRYPFGKLHEDVFTTYKLIHLAKKVVVSEYTGYVYRVNLNSITGVAFSEKRLDAVEGKIQQARFIAKHYPHLTSKAYSEIIYACNQCLIKIVKSDFKSKEVDSYLQSKYNKYGKYYLSEKNALYKKIICKLAMTDISLAKFALHILRSKI